MGQEHQRGGSHGKSYINPHGVPRSPLLNTNLHMYRMKLCGARQDTSSGSCELKIISTRRPLGSEKDEPQKHRFLCIT